MEPEDWEALKAQMDSPWGDMKLQCDQHTLTLQQQATAQSRSWATVVYVDGAFKGAWMDATGDGQPAHEEARRFLRRTSTALYTRKDIEVWRKAFGKREAAKKEAIKIVIFQPTWKSFSALKKHLLANNTNIQRIH